MKMNIYELEKQATPGPYESGNGWLGPSGTPMRTGSPHFVNGSHAFPHDAKLLAHCRNNFMKALKGLHDLADTIQYQTSFENAAYKECIALIKELEEVK
jgi:hypothetical protein